MPIISAKLSGVTQGQYVWLAINTKPVCTSRIRGVSYFRYDSQEDLNEFMRICFKVIGNSSLHVLTIV